MKLIGKIIGTCILAISFNGLVEGKTIPIRNSCRNDFPDKEKLIAVNDTFFFVSGCGNISFSGNVMENDLIPDDMTAKVQYVICAEKQFLSFGNNGNFSYYTPVGFSGLVNFVYQICDINDESNYTEASVYINIKSDFDCDEIFDEQDLDDDNDGIPDSVEGNGTIDTDSDGIPDNFDVDDDNDGIPDVREWQSEKNYLLPSGIDRNHNGWDDIYEEKVGSENFQAVDTDKDGIPDFLDNDSDSDNISDFVEATDSDFDGLPDISFIYSDFDNDGLDDAFDVVKYWRQKCNSAGSNVPLPDHNENGIPDFREKFDPNSKDEKGFLEYDTSMMTFQNPNNGLFSIQMSGYSNGQETYIKIFNLNGELIVDVRVTDSIVTMDLTTCQPGIYVVKIVSPQVSFSKKLILQDE